LLLLAFWCYFFSNILKLEGSHETERDIQMDG
jgi:hypothetical protein